MKSEATMDLSTVETGIPLWKRHFIQGGFFLVVWPTFNVLFISSVLLELDYLNGALLRDIAFQLYTFFALAFVLILVTQRLLPAILLEEKFWPQLGLHIGAIVLVGQFVGPDVVQTTLAEVPQPSLVPTVFMLFQVTLYVAIKTLILQRERYHAMKHNLRQSQMSALLSQTNPHFLFNTLNLLASEISRDPTNAREIVYDLSDLLRENIQAAEREFIRLEEEVRLATLYLTLQKKRFPERVEFEIDVDDDCLALPVPSLLLQPVVENVVKHVVAHSNDMTSLRLWAHRRADSLLVGVQNSGSDGTPVPITPKGGLRIVRETLSLHYHGRADMAVNSTSDGTQVTISVPIPQQLDGVE
jgi:hypothetical protein